MNDPQGQGWPPGAQPGYIPGGPAEPGYNPGYAYGPQGYMPYGHAGMYPGTPGQVTSDDTTWGMMSYVGALIAGFIAPLVIYFVKKRQPFVRFHAAQSLNYAITVMITMLGALALVGGIALAAQSWIPVILLIPFYVGETIAQYIYLIVAAIKSNKGEYYRIPTWTCWPMVR